MVERLFILSPDFGLGLFCVARPANIYNGKFTRRGKVKPLADQMLTVINEKLLVER